MTGLIVAVVVFLAGAVIGVAVGVALNRGRARMNRLLAYSRLQDAMGRVQQQDRDDEKGLP